MTTTAVLPESQWRARARAHAARADALTAGHLARRQAGVAHPVEDFLWNYYFLKPAHLRRWHPGAGVRLVAEGADERRTWRFYAGDSGHVWVDVPGFLRERGQQVREIADLLRATLSRPGSFGCFGLHEWAMVYRTDRSQIRHTTTPLRLPPEAIDAVVDSHTLACTHVDAFRFFTPAAAPRNAHALTRADQLKREQPGCLHAGMDLYKWAGKLSPLVPSDLLLDAFELARDIREVDMQASPYDVSAYRGASGGALTPIPIETAAGKKEYVARQRAFTVRANELRRRLLVLLEELG